MIDKTNRKRRHRRLNDLLGETRGEGYEDFLASLAVHVEPGNVDHADRAEFMRLFSVALVEALRTRDDATREGSARTPARSLQMLENAAICLGGVLTAYALSELKPDADANAKIEVANFVMLNIGAGASGVLKLDAETDRIGGGA